MTFWVSQCFVGVGTKECIVQTAICQKLAYSDRMYSVCSTMGHDYVFFLFNRLSVVDAARRWLVGYFKLNSRIIVDGIVDSHGYN